MGYYYEKFNRETGEMECAPYNDYDGRITGKIVFNLKAYFDENPDERIRLGYIKHITEDTRKIAYNSQNQYLSVTTVQVDEHTVKDVHYVEDASEEMLGIKEIVTRMGYSANRSGIVFTGGVDDMTGFDDL